MAQSQWSQLYFVPSDSVLRWRGRYFERMSCQMQCILLISWEGVTLMADSKQQRRRNTLSSYANVWWPLYRLMLSIASARATFMSRRLKCWLLQNSNGCRSSCMLAALFAILSGYLTISHMYSLYSLYRASLACQHRSLVFQLWNGEKTCPACLSEGVKTAHASLSIRVFFHQPLTTTTGGVRLTNGGLSSTSFWRGED